MKISLFYKPSLNKAYIFVFIIVLITSIPNRAHASFFSMFSSVFDSKKVQASEEIKIKPTGIIHNSQNLPLLEASTEPDMKNIKDTPNVDVTIIENQALLPNDSFSDAISGVESTSSEGIITYKVKKGDTLSQIAEDFYVSVNTIRWENNISGQKIRIGQKLYILPVTGVKHTVRKGDNLAKIANKYDATIEDILVYNGIHKEDILHQKDVLIIPNGVIKTVYSKRSSSHSYSYNTRSIAGYYLRPTLGRVTSNYGPRRGGFHYGVDIGAKRGTKVLAAASGVVIKTIRYCREGHASCGGRYGNYILIQHNNGTRTRYAHLSKSPCSCGTESKSR